MSLKDYAMHEKKNPNRPLIVYYIIALVVVMLLNALLFPQIERYSVKQVDYSISFDARRRKS